MKEILNKKWIWSVFAFVIPFLFCFANAIGYSIYPFGENCILHVDMYHQYCPFFVELREKLLSGEGLLYSFRLGLGSDFFAHFAYYLASPLNWLIILVPKKFVIEFMTMTIWTKIALSGLFFFWFLIEKFHLEGKDKKYHMNTILPALIFSTAYAFSGYVATYSWNIMWMDVIALTPLVIMGLERLVNKGKPGLYYGTLSLAILSNFYIAMILCIFLVLYFGILFFQMGKGKILACVRFALFSLLAGGTGAVLLIPVAIVLKGTASGEGGLPEHMEWYFNFFEEVSRMSFLAEPYTVGDEHWPALYCGCFTVLFVVLYFMNKRIRIKDKLLYLLLIVLFLVSFSNNYLDFIWHGLRYPTSLPARQSFLFIFIMLMLAFDAFRKQKGNRVWHFVVAIVVCVFAFVMSAITREVNIVDKICFLSSGILIGIYGILTILKHVGKAKIRNGAGDILIIFALLELILNVSIMGVDTINRTKYLEKMEGYEALYDMAYQDAKSEVKEDMPVFFRIEDTERKTKNDGCLLGYPSATIFSTLMNIDVADFYQSGLMEGGKNYYCYNGATPLLSSMLSVKYMFIDHELAANSVREKIGKFGGYYLYKNQYCLPIGFVMEESAVKAWEEIGKDKFAQINGLANVLGVEGKLLTKTSCCAKTSDGKTEIEILEDGFYYARAEKSGVGLLITRINQEPYTLYNKTTRRHLFEIGDCKKGDVVEFINEKNEKIDYELYKMDMDVLDQAYEILSQQTMTLTEYQDDFLKGNIDVKEAGRLIFAIPKDPGWSIRIDGEKVTSKAVKEAFISVSLEEGNHEIELEYQTPGLETGLIISIFSIIIAFILLLLGGRCGKKAC